MSCTPQNCKTCGYKKCINYKGDIMITQRLQKLSDLKDIIWEHNGINFWLYVARHGDGRDKLGTILTLSIQDDLEYLSYATDSDRWMIDDEYEVSYNNLYFNKDNLKLLNAFGVNILLEE